MSVPLPLLKPSLWTQNWSSILAAVRPEECPPQATLKPQPATSVARRSKDDESAARPALSFLSFLSLCRLPSLCSDVGQATPPSSGGSLRGFQCVKRSVSADFLSSKGKAPYQLRQSELEERKQQLKQKLCLVSTCQCKNSEGLS